MFRTATIAALALAATPAAAFAADATPPGVPAGTLETHVERVQLSGTTDLDGTTRVVTYLTSDSGRTVTTDAADGSLQFESSSTPKLFSFYTAVNNTLELQNPIGAPPALSVAQTAAYFRQGVAKGCYEKTGRRGDLVKYKLIPGPSCSEPDSRATVTYDTAKKQVVKRVSTVAGQAFRQVTTLVSTKQEPLTDANAAQLQQSEHPGATVRDLRG